MANDKEASFIMRLVDLVSGPLKKIRGEAGQAVEKLKQLGNGGGGSGWGGKLGGIFKSLSGGAGDFKKNIMSAAGEVPGLSRAIELVTNPYVAIAAAVVALGVALTIATQKAIAFEHGMSQVNTTAQLGKPELKQLTGELLDMGANSTVALDQIPGAFNSVISAVGDTKKSLAIFEPSLKAAQAGFTDIKVVTEALTNTMGSVGDATPTEALDVMFATMRLGKAEFKDIAAYLPKIIPLANNVGIKYQEIAGAFALMTGKGQSAEQTAMLLQNAMTALSKSEVIYGTKSQAGFIRSGIAIFDHAGKMRNLVDIVGDLSKRTQGMTDQQRQAFLNGLGLDAQAAASFSVMAQNAGDLKKFVDGTRNSAGEMNKAYGLSLDTTSKMTMMGNKWEKMVTEIGFQLLPLWNECLDMASGALDLITQHSGGFVSLLKVAAYVLMPPFVAAFVGIKVVLAGIYAAWRLVNAAITFQFTLVKALFSWLGGAVDWVYNKLGGEGSLIDKLFGGSSSVWDSVKTLFDNFLKLSMATLDAIDLAAEGKFRNAADLMKQTWSEVNGGTVRSTTTFNDFFGLGKKDGGGAGKAGTSGAGAALKAQNKGTSVEGDKNRSRIVNTRIDKVEVNVKVANTDPRNMQAIGNQVASVIVGAVRDSEIILSTAND
jgi:TP901 family phage tail tape measure protein